MTRLATLIVVLATLVVVPAAAAKQITKVTACGDGGCVTTTDPAILTGLMNGGPPTVPSHTGAPAVRLTATISERPGGKAIARVHNQWVPSLGLLVAEDGTWMKLPADAARALDALGVQPSAGPRPAAAPPAPADGGAPTWLLVGAGLALAAAVLFVLRRRRVSYGLTSGARS
jgi:LPXTG-motif cell wall-anchored protein